MLGRTNLEEEIEKLQFGTLKGDINMILLGETGVGKSTFINALVNYLTYTSFENALSKETLILVPFVFTVKFDDVELQKFGVGFDSKCENLNLEDNTRTIRKYVFPFRQNESKFHIVDTPGTMTNDIIAENILRYISNLHTINALCFFFDQSNIEHNIRQFKYFAEHFFPQISRSALQNVVFIFTKTEGITFDVRYALHLLRTTIDEIGNKFGSEIPLEKNVFYFENNNLQYLIAYKNGIKNMELKEHKARQSWIYSTKECWR